MSVRQADDRGRKCLTTTCHFMEATWHLAWHVRNSPDIHTHNPTHLHTHSLTSHTHLSDTQNPTPPCFTSTLTCHLWHLACDGLEPCRHHHRLGLNLLGSQDGGGGGTTKEGCGSGRTPARRSSGLVGSVGGGGGSSSIGDGVVQQGDQMLRT